MIVTRSESFDVVAETTSEAIELVKQGKGTSTGSVTYHTREGDSSRYPVTSVARPENEWPSWAKVMKLLAIPADIGMGDVTARLIGNDRSELFKSWFKTTFGRNCGCEGRQKLWNRLYPLNQQPTKKNES